MRLKPYHNIPAKDWLVPPKTCRRQDAGRESVRQWLISELARSYFYPADWLRKRVQLVGPEEDLPNVPAGFYGFCLHTSKGDPFLWASVEQTGKAAKAEARLRGVLSGSPFARLGLTTDGTGEGTRCLRQRSASDEADFVVDLETFTTVHGIGTADLLCGPGAAGRTPRQRSLEPVSESLEDVFFEAHSHIRDIDGLHADESLDELCKVLYAKLFDEEMTAPGTPYALQRAASGTTEEYAVTIRRTYADANEYDVRVFSLKVPGYERSRGVFNDPIKLSSPALVKVMETLEPYCLTRSSIDVKGRAFQRVLGAGQRAGMGQYFTPRDVIQLVVFMVGPTTADLILDPFAGSGHFLTRSLDYVRANRGAGEEKRIDEFAFNKLHGFEKSDRMVRIAMTDMRLHGDGHSNIRCTDALLDFANYSDVRPGSFDVVMTNPPFGSLLGPEAVARLGRFSLAAHRGNVPLEVLGLERCIQFLRPGGRIGIVLPDGVFANRQTSHVREWLAEQVKVRAIVSLPVETFSPFGANIKTSVLVARKWKAGERRSPDYKVYLARVDNVGYDATGRLHAGSELDDVASGFADFLKREEW